MITNSLDWDKAETELRDTVKLIKDPRKAFEAKKVLRNFDAMIKKLSQLELEARRSASQSRRKVDEQLELINTELNNFEQWVTLLLLT